MLIGLMLPVALFLAISAVTILGTSWTHPRKRNKGSDSMQISNLPASGSFNATDVLVIEVNGITYRLTGATLAAALKTIGNYVSASDYPITVAHGGTGASNAAAARSNLGLGNVDNTSDADKPVSTAQAAALAAQRAHYDNALAKIGLTVYNDQFYIQPYEGEEEE